MPKIELFHGSDHIIKLPGYDAGKPYNDYGKGFYCTRISDMAKEWACKQNKDGFANHYELEMDSLRVLNLMDGNHSILNWIALLLKNREFSLDSDIAMDAKDYIMEHFLIDLAPYDVVVGYRANDSYFSYAQSFVENGLHLRGLSQALRLGKLAEQTVLISPKAFDKIRFIDAEAVDRTEYYPKFLERDTTARQTYRREIRRGKTYRDDIFVMDILREGMKNNDPRIQRIVSE